MSITRRAFRSAAWGVKGVLALVVLAALVAWPWSHADPGWVDVETWRPREHRVGHVLLSAGWDGGRVGMRWVTESLSGAYLLSARVESSRAAPGWSWEWRRGRQWWALDAGKSYGPFRWASLAIASDNIERRSGTFSTPCWLLAAVAGAWPATSAVRFVYRRRRRCRLAAAPNRCRGCGYDLRATPAADGPGLARCPECGRSSGDARGEAVTGRGEPLSG